jgi:hypothetical protein
MWPPRTFRLSIAFAKAAHHSPCPGRSAASAAATHVRFPAREGFRASTRAALAILALAALLTAALPSPAAQAQASMTVINGTPPTYAVTIAGSPPLLVLQQRQCAAIGQHLQWNATSRSLLQLPGMASTNSTI